MQLKQLSNFRVHILYVPYLPTITLQSTTYYCSYDKVLFLRRHRRSSLTHYTAAFSWVIINTIFSSEDGFGRTHGQTDPLRLEWELTPIWQLLLLLLHCPQLCACIHRSTSHLFAVYTYYITMFLSNCYVGIVATPTFFRLLLLLAINGIYCISQ